MRRFRGGHVDIDVDLMRSLRGRALSYAPPWALGISLLPTVAITHHAWGTDLTTAPWAAVGLTAAGTTLTMLAWTVGKARGLVTRAHATVSTGLASLWLLTGTIVGVTGALFSAYAITAATVAISWNIRKALRGDGGETDGGWNETAEKIGLLGTKLDRPQVEGHRVTAGVQLRGGAQTIEDLQAAKQKIASLFRVPRNGVRVTEDPDRSDRAKLVVVPRDMLRKPIPWPGPSHPGGSAADPIHAGLYEDGEVARYWLAGDEDTGRNATHLLWMGQNGAGKSEGALQSVCELLTRSDEVVWVADPVKGEQTFGDAKAGLDWFATNKDEAKALLRAVQAIVTARADDLGKRGYKQWKPGCGVTHLTVVLEEAAGWLSDSRLLVRLVQQSRSVGVSIWVSVQRATHTNIPTDVRQQLGAAFCFGVKNDDDAGYALSDHVLEAGANPGVWGNRKPGYAYLEAPGVEEERWTTPLRTYRITPEQVRDVVAEYASLRASLDSRSADAAGQAYYNRTRYAADCEGDSSSTVVSSLTAPGVTHRAVSTHQEEAMSDEDAFDNDVIAALDSDQDTDTVGIPTNPEPGFMDDIDPAHDIVEDTDARLVIMPPADDTRPPASVARQMLIDYLTEMATAGHATVRPVELAELRIRIGRSQAWLTGELQRLQADGMLAPHPDWGVYQLREPAAA